MHVAELFDNNCSDTGIITQCDCSVTTLIGMYIIIICILLIREETGLRVGVLM